MKKRIHKIAILAGIFVLALAGYFMLSRKEQKTDVAYTAIEDADLPVAYTQMYGKKMNSLYGFVNDNPASAGRGNLTVLPADRQLSVSFHGVTSKVKGIQYEIRSLDGERLIERTVLEDWSQKNTTVDATLPVQNMLTKDEEYRMALAIVTEDNPAVYYYTRIVWSDNTYVQEMITLAEDFSAKTMNYETAKELTTYLETDAAADNSSLGRVSLKNSFSQLTWRSMNIVREGEIFVALKELQGIMGTVQLNYVASRTNEDERKDYFEVSETFTMKWNAQRIYMMDYDRRVNQIFSGDENQYSDKRIMLGISDTEELSQVSDAAGKYKAFVANRALWCYNTEENESTKVFAFRKSETDLQANYDHHGIKILSVSDTGVIDFLVYGYMNRGNHEGTTGVAVYRYESGGNTLTERMYLPSDEDYWNLRQNIKTLSYLSEGQVLYILMNHAVFGVDLTSKEYMVVADGLTGENFAAESSLARIAWQEGSDLYGAPLLNVMDLKTGNKNEIKAPAGENIRLVGFVGDDLVYGLSKQEQKLTANGRIIGVPLYALEIVGSDMTVQTRYEKPGIFITDVEIRDSRVHLMKMTGTGDNYVKTEEDTLVCNEQVTPDPLAGIGYLAAQEAGRQYFVQLSETENGGSNVRVHVPKKVVAEEDNVKSLKANKELTDACYFAYSEDRMNGSFVEFSEAVQAAYDGMGIVTDQAGQTVWVRANRDNARTIKEVKNYVPKINRYLQELSEGSFVSADGTRIIDARGCTLNQILYFVHAGHPVAAYLGGGEQAIIYGYDQYNITCLRYPGTEREYSEKIGLNDAAAFFEAKGENDFVCFLTGK